MWFANLIPNWKNTQTYTQQPHLKPSSASEKYVVRPNGTIQQLLKKCLVCNMSFKPKHMMASCLRDNHTTQKLEESEPHLHPTCSPSWLFCLSSPSRELTTSALDEKSSYNYCLTCTTASRVSYFSRANQYLPCIAVQLCDLGCSPREHLSRCTDHAPRATRQ